MKENNYNKKLVFFALVVFAFHALSPISYLDDNYTTAQVLDCSASNAHFFIICLLTSNFDELPDSQSSHESDFFIDQLNAGRVPCLNIQSPQPKTAKFILEVSATKTIHEGEAYRRTLQSSVFSSRPVLPVLPIVNSPPFSS